jgi:hypothetical protein
MRSLSVSIITSSGEHDYTTYSYVTGY